jgi:hypothetical protein
MRELVKPSDLAEETSARVRADLERSRAKLAASVEALRGDLKDGAYALRQSVSVKAWIAKNPWGLVVGGLALGLFLGTRRRP